MKESMYNFFINSDAHNKTLAYNSFTNAFGVIEKKDYQKLDDHLKNKTYEEIDSELYSTLMEQGFIVEDDFDELASLDCSMSYNKYRSNTLSLTIAPTQDCNFRCVYCYEKDALKEKYMNEETMNSLLNFIEKRMKGLYQLGISWYGGEPLLAIDIIEEITEKVLKLCEKYEIKYSSSIVTNGYLLTNENVKKLIKCKVTSAQITLDGDKSTHDSRRYLKSGQGTFDKIVENLKDILEEDMNISLRINVDRNNVSQANELANIIRNFDKDKKIYMYLGKVVDSNDCYTKSKCLDNKEYSVESYKFFQNDAIKAKKLYPILKSTACGADCISYLVVDADGHLYKCWEDIGNDNMIVGNIHSGINFNSKTNLSYLRNNPTTDEMCAKCKVLPVCMGGCIKRNLMKDSCNTIKYNMKNVLEQVYKDYLEKEGQ